ncbi:MAG TPA: VWA domain-containing protein [Pyrinomonadaceae bacterium]
MTRLLPALFVCLLLTVASATAQQPTPTPEAQPDEVLRINTELVQTDVMVFDKSGRFVDNLQREQFELRVDGKAQPISFFDRVTAGSASEDAQLAAARGGPRPVQDEQKTQASVGLPDRGRVVVFFIDDLHLASDSLKRTQKAVLHFINDEMGQNDRVAIATTGGQLGFLQQLTDNKAVLRAAVERLKLQPQLLSDMQQPPMTEYLAQAIIALGNMEVLGYYMEPLIKEGVPQTAAEQIVKSRANQILKQAQSFTRNTFFSLDSLARNISVIPGRKLVFFVSDGFLLTANEMDIHERLWAITNTAARNNVVIYTMDARGLSVPSMFDASTGGAFDPTGRITRAMHGETSAQQEALRTLADSTGGRALLNTNALDAAITKTLQETSTYYVIAWRPDTDEQKTGKLRRIELKIAGRPDLNVQVKRGFLNPDKEQRAKAAAAEAARKGKLKTPVDELRAAIGAFYPNNTLPTALSLDYLDEPKLGVLLTISMQIPAEALAFDAVEGKYKGAVDVGGNVYNVEGKVGVSFQEHLDISSAAMEPVRSNERDVFYRYNVRLDPGLYQVRVAARDARNGHIGVATQWIEVPDLKANRLALSSLFIGELTAADMARNVNASDATMEARLNVARRFQKTSRLRFLTFIYNAKRGETAAAPPDVAIQVQVLRDDQPVLTTALRKVATAQADDLARLPYAAEIPLDNMLAGHYLLQVTAIDRVAKTSASQRINFEIQ